MARLAQARYPAQILIFFKLKMASPAILFFEEYLGKVNKAISLFEEYPGQLVILRPTRLQTFLGGMH